MHPKLFNSLAACAIQTRGAICRLALPVAALLISVSSPVHAQPYVNVTVGGAISPGVFGEIAIGNNPPPPVINPRSIIVGPPIVGVAPRYLYVPLEHQRDWARHCSYYRACGHPVHFVEFEERNRWWEHRNEHLRGRDQYHREEFREERGRAESRGRGEDRGRGNGRGRDRD